MCLLLGFHRQLMFNPPRVRRARIRRPDGEWDTKEARMQRVVQFMEQRHNLAMARRYDEIELAQKITKAWGHAQPHVNADGAAKKNL